MLRINGELTDEVGKYLSDYLSEKGYDLSRVAVELNGDIVPKSEYEVTKLQDEDSVEIVCFVGGG